MRRFHIYSILVLNPWHCLIVHRNETKYFNENALWSKESNSDEFGLTLGFYGDHEFMWICRQSCFAAQSLCWDIFLVYGSLRIRYWHHAVQNFFPPLPPPRGAHPLHPVNNEASITQFEDLICVGNKIFILKSMWGRGSIFCFLFPI